MRNYYFLATALPTLQIGVPPEISYNDFQDLIHDNLSSRDMQQVEVIRLLYDIQNIRAFWKKEELDPRGNFNELDLEEALLARKGFPEYVYDFLDAYDSLQLRLQYFPTLISSYFRNEAKKAQGFLKQYLMFERYWRLVFAGFRAKQLDRDVAHELQFEDPNDDVVAQILAQKDAKNFVPPEGYEDLKMLFEEHAKSPMDLFKAICEYRFHHIEEMLSIDVFSIDYILGYMVKLITIEKWQELDQQKGFEVIKKAVQFS